MGDMMLSWSESAPVLESLSHGNFDVQYDIDERGRTSSVTWSHGGNAIFSYALVYDAGSQVVQKTEIFQGQETVYEYEYDSRSRLTMVVQDDVVVETYDYDAVGNRTSARAPGLGAQEVQAQYNDSLQTTSQGNTAFTWDGNGMLSRIEDTLGGEAVDLVYSPDGQLRSATLMDGTMVTWKYDAFGNRVSRYEDGVPVAHWAYDTAGVPMARYNGDGTLLRIFLYTQGLVPAAYWEDGELFHYLLDSDYSVRGIVNEAGQLLQKISYDSLGNVLSMQDSGFEVDFAYSGGRPEEGTGLLRMGARDYQPVRGAFTSRDPIGVLGGFHPYLYANGDQVNLDDLTGLESGAKKAADTVNGVMGGPAGTAIGQTASEVGEAMGGTMGKVGGKLGPAITVATTGYNIGDTLYKQYNGEISTSESVGIIAETGLRAIGGAIGSTVGATVGAVGGALIAIATGGTGAVAIPVGAVGGAVAGGIAGDWVAGKVADGAKWFGRKLGEWIYGKPDDPGGGTTGNSGTKNKSAPGGAPGGSSGSP